MKEQCSSYERYQGIREPRCNCKACWFLYFSLNRGVVAAVQSALHTMQDGAKKITRVRGNKFLKMYRVFEKEMLKA